MSYAAKTLITIAGIDKVIPRFRDLEVFLQTLPRSATGERMNPYNSVWTGVHAGDGPEDFHVILMDNGRTQILADEGGREVMHCIRCGACQNACPVYRETGGQAYGSVYSGPIGAILTPQLQQLKYAESLPFASSLCGACYEVCPVKINIPEILVHLRNQVVLKKTAGAGVLMSPEAVAMKMVSRVFRSERSFRAAQRLGRLAQRALERSDARGEKWVSWLPGILGRMDVDARSSRDAEGDLPRVVGKTGRREGRPRMTSRETMLAKIRAANGGVSSLAVAQKEWLGLGRKYATGSMASREEVLALFVERLADYDAVVQRCAPEAVAQALDGMIAAARVKRVGVPDGLTAWVLQNAELVSADGLDHEALNLVEAVLTESTLGIAETGTLVLQGVPGQGRRALSLVPDVHFCVVRAEDVVATVPEAMAQLAATSTLPTTFLSGPSATADIEMTRIKGVHGPRFLHVLLVD